MPAYAEKVPLVFAKVDSRQHLQPEYEVWNIETLKSFTVSAALSAMLTYTDSTTVQAKWGSVIVWPREAKNKTRELVVLDLMDL
jgi:hypothetical protein